MVKQHHHSRFFGKNFDLLEQLCLDYPVHYLSKCMVYGVYIHYIWLSTAAVTYLNTSWCCRNGHLTGNLPFVL